MRALVHSGTAKARKIARSDVQDDEQSFGATIADVARLLWPTKTAAHLAAAAGCSERAAEFYLAGDRDWSGDALAVIVSEILRRHGMRNARVKAKL